MSELVQVDRGRGRTFHVLGGDVVECKITGKESGGRFSLFETMVPAGGGPPPHVHRREDETFYVVEGEFAFHTPTTVVRMGAGGVLHAPRDTPHYFRNVGATEGRLVIAVHPAGFEEFLAAFSEIPHDQPPDMARIGAVGAKFGIEFLPDSF